MAKGLKTKGRPKFKKYNENFETAVRAILVFREIAQTQIPEIRQQIGTLIEERETNPHIIEHTLDLLLDMAQLGFCEPEFRRLNNYYATLDEEASKDYTRFYKEMYEED